MLIRVTADHLRQGKRGSCRECAIVLALNEATGRRWRIGSVLTYSPQASLVYAAENEDGGRVHLPDWVGDRLDDFDDGLYVAPFAFEVPDR